MHITSTFDAGNIKVVDKSNASNIQLEINKDHQSDFYQWFYFRASGIKHEEHSFEIMNAKGAAYPDGFKDYKVAASYDRLNWFRIPADFDGETLSFSINADQDSVYFAYFAPYSQEQHANLVASCLDSEQVSLEVLGQTLDGRDMDLLKIGDESPEKKKYWLIARQHPGETMAEWWMEGFLERLLDEDDAVCRALLEQAVFYVVPNMNPDGSFRGHLRTNAAGANLNREWQNPTMQRSPEVFLVLNKMREIGLDFCLDVHGDEALPYNFIAGAEGIPGWSDTMKKDLEDFKNSYAKLTPDFQTKVGYPVDEPGKANMTVCTNFIAQEFKTLSMTLEMPFKDTAKTPDNFFGWSPERSRKLGASVIDALWATFK